MVKVVVIADQYIGINVHLDRQKGTYYASLKVPKDVREIIGKTAFRKTLKTKDKLEAQRRAIPLVEQWKVEIAVARLPLAERLEAELSAARKQYRELEKELNSPNVEDHDSYELQDLMGVLGDQIIDKLLSVYRVNDPEELTIEQLRETQRAYKVATGERAPFAEFLDDHIDDSVVEPKTKQMKRQQIERYAQLWPMLHEATGENVRSYIKTLSKEDGLSNASIKRNLSALSTYWEYLKMEKGVVAEEHQNPFRGHKLPQENRKVAARDKRRAFSKSDVAKLHEAIKERATSNTADDLDRDLLSIFLFAIYTGMRREEIGQLKLSDVQNGLIVISDAKTKTSNRTIPLHSKLVPLVENRTASNDYLFPSLTIAKFGKRTDGMGKRFGRIKKALGYDNLYNFHSLRKTVATQLEQASVLENVAADILGHEKGTTNAFKLYSGDTSMEQKRDAVEKISYSLT